MTPTLIGGTPALDTDDDGFGYFTISYPKTEASWVMVRITANVAGGLPENRDISEFQLRVALPELKPDDNPAAFVVSPYSVNGTDLDCTLAARLYE